MTLYPGAGAWWILFLAGSRNRCSRYRRIECNAAGIARKWLGTTHHSFVRYLFMALALLSIGVMILMFIY